MNKAIKNAQPIANKIFQECILWKLAFIQSAFIWELALGQEFLSALIEFYAELG